MNYLAVDQARNGAWSVFNSCTNALIGYGTFSFSSDNYTYDQVVMYIGEIVSTVIDTYDISVVFLEDIQLRKNTATFKQLAQLQGVLLYICERRKLLHWLIAPAQWQSYCRNTDSVAKEKYDSAPTKKTKALSLQFVKDMFGIETTNDNLADSICIGCFATNNLCNLK